MRSRGVGIRPEAGSFRSWKSIWGLKPRRNPPEPTPPTLIGSPVDFFCFFCSGVSGVSNRTFDRQKLQNRKTESTAHPEQCSQPAFGFLSETVVLSNPGVSLSVVSVANFEPQVVENVQSTKKFLPLDWLWSF